jgi:hypothetical protein
MKTSTIIIAAVLSFQISSLFAGNNETFSTVNNESVAFNMSLVAPVIPTEATFEEVNLTSASTFDFSSLAPATPAEADFFDIVPEKNIDFTILAPVTPFEADFNDAFTDADFNVSSFAPVTPAEADFE